MKTIMKDIFDKISEKEGHIFEPNIQYVQKTPLEIETQDGYVGVVAMMVKNDILATINTTDHKVEVSKGHLIGTSNGLRRVFELKVGDLLANTNGLQEIISIEFSANEELVYDLTIDSEDHLYVDANGFVHHNTYGITQGPRSLAALLGPEGNKWTYHAGAKISSYSFYRTLFLERDKIIVFDEADSLLKHDEIVMMLKPILDTSGSNMAEYLPGTESMTGKGADEIESYSKRVDDILASGGSIGTGKDDVKLPSKFKFSGGMVFISNMRANQIEKAIMSRSIFVDVYLAQRDVLKRIKSIGYAIAKSMGVNKKDIDDIIEALSTSSNGKEVEITYMTPEYARKSKEVTVRAMQLAIILKKSGLSRWAALASLYA